MIDFAPVRDADDAPDGDRGGILEEGANDPRQGVSLDQAVRIHRAEERRVAVVHAGVQGVGLPAVLLVEHPEIRMGATLVHLLDGRRLQVRGWRPDGGL